MDMKELQSSFDELNRATLAMQEKNDERLKLIEKNAGTAELEAEIKAINAVITEKTAEQESWFTKMKAQEERLANLEAEIDAGLIRGDGKKSKQELEYEAKFDQWIRACRDDGAPRGQLYKDLIDAENAVPQLKAITGSSTAAGGAAMPVELARRINDQVRESSPLRPLVTTRSISSRSYSEVLNLHGEGSGWVAEEGTRSETATPTFRVITPTMGTLYAYPKATEESLDDVFFDVGGFLADSTALDFSIAESTAILSGDGTAKPTGMLNATPVTTDDGASPPRAAAALEYVPLTTASPVAGVQADQLIELFYTLKAAYRQNANWLMNSVTIGAIRTLKDSTNQYIWQPGLQAGAPSQLLGRPVVTIEHMPAISANLFPVAVGDFKRGYLLVDRVGLRVTVDDNITTPGYVKWYIRRREGGIVLDNNAIKLGKYANS